MTDQEPKKAKTAFITGATSGIGRATAQLFAAQGMRLVICGRRTERLEALKETLGKRTEVHTLCFDVRDKKAVFDAIGGLPEAFAGVDILINNAGNAHGLDSIEKGDLDDWDAMIDGNVKGLLYVTKALVPQMVERRSGHIVNIGSIAGKEVYPKGNVYCASKFAVDALTKALQIDLNAHGIRVGAVNPGAVETEFSMVRFKNERTKAEKVYEGFTPLSAQDIAETLLFVVTRPAHVNIADLLVLPTAQANATIIKRG